MKFCDIDFSFEARWEDPFPATQRAHPYIKDRTADWNCGGWTESNRKEEVERQLEIAVRNNQERIADYYPEDGGIYVFWWRQTEGEPSFTVNHQPNQIP